MKAAAGADPVRQLLPPMPELDSRVCRDLQMLAAYKISGIGKRRLDRRLPY